MYFLDSDILVGLLRNNPYALNKLKSLLVDGINLYTSTINLHELVKGAYLSNNPPKNLEKVKILVQTLNILQFDRDSAFISGRLSAEQEIKGKPIGQNDLLIASMVISNNLKLITRNKKHFEWIEDIEVEEW